MLFPPFTTYRQDIPVVPEKSSTHLAVWQFVGGTPPPMRSQSPSHFKAHFLYRNFALDIQVNTSYSMGLLWFATLWCLEKVTNIIPYHLPPKNGLTTSKKHCWIQTNWLCNAKQSKYCSPSDTLYVSANTENHVGGWTNHLRHHTTN